MGSWFLVATVFLACAVEAVEALTVVLAAGVTRDWRSALTGVGGGLVVLAAVVAVLGPALTVVPLGALRLVVGALLTAFGTFWGAEGAGVRWPGGDAAILVLLAVIVAFSVAAVAALRTTRVAPAPAETP